MLRRNESGSSSFMRDMGEPEPVGQAGSEAWQFPWLFFLIQEIHFKLVLFDDFLCLDLSKARITLRVECLQVLAKGANVAFLARVLARSQRFTTPSPDICQQFECFLLSQETFEHAYDR